MTNLVIHEKYPAEGLGVEIIPVFTGEKTALTLRDSGYELEKTTLFRARTEDEKDALYVGLGDKTEISPFILRCAGGAAGRFIRKNKYNSAYLCSSFSSGAEEFAEGFLMGAYEFNRYKTQEKEHTEDITLHTVASSVTADRAKKIRAMADGVNFTRDLSNMSSNELYPLAFAEIISKRFAGTDVKVRIYKAEELEKEGFVGTAAVGRGSGREPCYLELTYKTDGTKPLLALLGKGVTFDMGGMHVKLDDDLSVSRTDMSGGAAVAGAVDIISSLGVKTNVAALIPLAENLPGSRALLPGTVIRYPQGPSVEICNTDCEGRLILADALLHAVRMGAKYVIDIATLTGNVQSALGANLAGIWGDKGLCAALINIGDALGDRVWEMPLVTEYDKYIESCCADIRNSPKNSDAGAIAAALFLKHFIKEGVTWAHIDMASVDWTKSPHGYLPKGASGFGARLLAEYAIGCT